MPGIAELALGAAPLAGGALLGLVAGNLRGPDVRGLIKQDMDLLMDIGYTNAVFLGAQDAGGLAPLVINQAAGLISQYKISGTLKKPQYDKILLPEAASLGKKIGDLLQGLTS